MKLSLLLISLMIVGCIPIPMTADIYKPSADGGVIRESMCGYNQGSGIWDELETSVSTVKFYIRAFKVEDKVRIHISINTQTSNNVRLSSNKFTITSENKSSDHFPKLLYTYKDHPKTLPVNETLIQEYGTNFVLFFDVSVPNEKEFILNMPRIHINNVEHNMPNVTFTPDTSLYLMTVNC